MKPTKSDLIEAIKKHILTELLRSNVALEADTPLIQNGYLTSLQTIELVDFLAEQYDVEIEPEEVNEEEFDSLNSIAELVLRKLPD